MSLIVNREAIQVDDADDGTTETTWHFTYPVPRDGWEIESERRDVVIVNGWPVGTIVRRLRKVAP
jgi:hypothetical protein